MGMEMWGSMSLARWIFLLPGWKAERLSSDLADARVPLWVEHSGLVGTSECDSSVKRILYLDSASRMDIQSEPKGIPFERAVSNAIDIRERGRTINKAECGLGEPAEAASREPYRRQRGSGVGGCHDAIRGQ